MSRHFLSLALVVSSVLACGSVSSRADAPKRVLLLGQKRDHPPGSHEYVPGLNVLHKCLRGVQGLDLVLMDADEPWPQGPREIDRADGLVLYLGQGARWVQNDPQRLRAIRRFAQRGGALVALHWAIGAKEDRYIEPYRHILGGIHGGKDRKYIFTKAPLDVRVVAPSHPITTAIAGFPLQDEFYYHLKFAEDGQLTPILQITVAGEPETVAWTYERPDGGRSFGFSGMHFHDNWRLEPCRRLAAQAVLWTLKMPVPADGLPVDVSKEDLRLPNGPATR